MSIWIEQTQKHKKNIAEINDFMKQLFPIEELRNYMWNHLASTLIGGNKPQTFNMYTGCGRNGKSKLIELMTDILGDYKGVVPTSLVTTNRPTIGGLSPEVAKLKGIRYAVMQEPSKGQRLNDGIMKELTGEDVILARSLFKEPIEFKPQFKLVVATNNLFVIRDNTDGTWRRIRLVEFLSKFVDEPTPTEISPYEFLVDRDIDVKFKKWKHIFIALLVERACETMGHVEDCPMVTKASDQYRKDQDYLHEFVSLKIIKKEGKVLKQREVFEEFKTWYTVNYGKNIPKGKELYSYLDKQIGKYKRGWKGYTINYDEDNEELDSDGDVEY